MTYYLMSWPPIKVLPDGTRIQLEVDENGELREPGELRRSDYFGFGARVGRDGVNAREDVLRAQTLLGHAGYFDMERTEGPTGWYGKPLELGIRKFQKDNGLTVDGFMEPGGETLAALEGIVGDAFAPHKPPGLKIIDEHHERRARGEPGLLEIDRAKGRPFGVTLEATTRELKALPPGMRPAEMALRTTSNRASRNDEVQMASAASGTVGRRDPVIRSWPEGGPMVIGGGGGRGVGGALNNAGRVLDGAAQQPDKDVVKPSPGLAMTALLDGIAGGFGKVERHETDNTRTSSRILREECMRYLRSLELPDGVDHEHVAGAVDDEGREFGEKALKDGVPGGGGGHSFADLLLRIGKTYLGFNSATEKTDDVWTSREFAAFQKLLHNIGEGVAKITGKKREGEGEEEYRERASKVCKDGIDQALAKELERLQKEREQKSDGGQEPANFTSEPPSP